MLHLAPWILIAGLVAGGLSIDRIAGSYVELGHVGELRFVFIIVAACLAISQAGPPGSVEYGSLGPALWVTGVCGLHGLLILTWCWSTQSDFSIDQIFENVLMVLAMVAAYRLFADQPGMFLIAFQWLSVLVVVVITLLALAAAGSLQGELALIGAGGIGTARAVAVCFLYLAYLFLREPRLIYLLPMPILLAEIALSGSRAAFLGLLTGLMILWTFRRRVSRRSPPGWSMLFSLMAAGVGVLVIGLFWSPSRDIIMNFLMSNLVMEPLTSQASGIYLADRDLIFESAWRHFLDHFYTGSGLGSYIGPFGEIYPHNLVLNIADDAGIGAVIVLCALLAWPIQRLVRSQNSLAVLALSNAVFAIVVSMFAGTYYDARFIWVFLLLGLLLVEGGRQPHG